MRKMKIMFICTGNICRSAMAEGMMKKKIEDRKIEVDVYSCGIYAETGDYATYNAIEAVREYGVDISGHRATNIRESAIEEMDLILCATVSHRQSVLYLYPELEGKVYTMKEYAGIDENGKDLDIRDPWGYDENVYCRCALEIEDCLEKIVDKLEESIL